ncbi:MAG: glycosyltransferase [Acidobacteria bacterium]|nr:glycosyltransferase [Acidobacteriota bacterium]
MIATARRLVLLLLTVVIVPALALLALILLAVNLLARLAERRKPCALKDDQALSGAAGIIVLNWNGRDLLERNLPSVVEAVRVDGRPHEIMVVDNGSTDGSVEFLRSAFPGVRVLPLPSNLGFGGGNNAGARAAAHDILVLLNNDMRVDPGFLRPLLDGFGPDTFAVSSQIFLQDREARREETGRTTAVFRRGMIDFSHRAVTSPTGPRACYPALWAGGGSSAFHRRRFLALGGFDELYSPAYVEDTDLSYRAWKRGWEVLFAPASVVHHRHRASSSRRFRPAEMESLIRRNQLLFTWKNLSGWPFLLAHAAFLPWNCYRLARDSGLPVWKGVWAAAWRIGSAAAARLRAPFRPVRTDREIFALFEMPGLYFAKKRREGKAIPVPSRSDGRPRVLWLTAYLPHLGRHAGAGRMFQLLRRLAPRYRITLLSFLETDGERQFLSDVEPLCERVVAIRRRQPWRGQPWRRQAFAYEPFEEFYTQEMEDALQERLEEEDFELIQLEFTQMGWYAHAQFGIPMLLTKHEVDFAACLRRSRAERNPVRKLRWFYNYLQVLDREIRLLRRVHGAICMTDPDRIELEKFSRGVPIHVISTGVDLDYFRPPPEPGRNRRMVFVGAFQHHPNVEAMTYFCRKVLPLIRQRTPSAELCIVGSGPPRAITDLAGRPGIEVTGLVPDIRPYMAAASVYIAPLRLGVGIRGKILEAWGMAMPVVATPVAAAGLRAEPGVNMLIADDEESFAESVASLFDSAELRSRLGRAGRATAEAHYGWEAAAEQLDALYKEHLGYRE